MPECKGSDLSLSDQKYVKNNFIHRFTGDHTPIWAETPRFDGEPYPLQFIDDKNWLENTIFVIKNNGHIDKRSRHCDSTPTFPNNPELRKKNA